MGLKLLTIKLMLPALAAARAAPDPRVLLLGKQDLYFTYDQLAAFFRAEGVEFLEIPEAERKLTDSFGFVSHEDWWQYKNFVHQETFFRMLGFKQDHIDTLDSHGYEGAEIIHDLNQPIPDRLREKYDLVLDTGTIEHVFDIRQAFWNIHDLTRTGGSVFHLSPANMLDHGLFNLNANLLADFYGQSGWQQEELFYVGSSQHESKRVTQVLLIDPGTYELPPAHLFLGLAGRFTKMPGSEKVVPKQGLYRTLHVAWESQSRDQSVHEAPAGAAPGALQRWAEAGRSLFWGMYNRISLGGRTGRVLEVRHPPVD